MAAPLVSVIIATRNRRTLLPRVLQSVYAQNYPNLEILVLDDASHDGTSDYIQSKHPDIRLFRFGQNHGQVAARNLMMREAIGDYIISLDDDAFLLTSETISRVVSRMEAEPEVAVAAFRVVGREQDAHGGPALGHYSNCFQAGAHCTRTTAFRQTGGYREYAFREYEEAEWALRLLDRGCRIFFFPSAVVVHEMSAQGRDLGLWYTSGPRNRLLGSWVNEPFPWWVLGTGRSITISLIHGMRHGILSHVLAGFAAAVKELPRVMSIRRPVSSKTMRLHLALAKRRITDSAEVKKLYESPPTLLDILLRKRC